MTVESAQYLSMYEKGSDIFHRGLLEVIPVIIDRGLIDLVGV